MECPICFFKHDDEKKFVRKCANSSSHLMCMDCYIQMAIGSVQRNIEITCPCCRKLIEEVDHIDLSSDALSDYLNQEVSHQNGKKHGICKTYYLNGSIMEEASFLRNMRHGKSTRYFYDGHIHSEFKYNHDKMNGLCRLYFPNGALQVLCHYRNDQLYGQYQEWNSSGDLILDYHIG